MSYAGINPIVGNQQVAFYGLPDTTAREKTGTIQMFVDPYWGGLEVMYVRAGGSIRQFGGVVVTPVVATSAIRYDATEVPNTANLGRPVYVALTSMTVGQFGWVALSGMIPINCTADIAADTAFGIVAVGQFGAIANGKQVLNARSILSSTATVVKVGNANAGSKLLQISGADGWFIGAYLSGTGVASGATIVDIDPSGTQVTMSAVSTALINGNVTATYNNATVYYNVAILNRSFAQGQTT